jgi:hypothetical protein
MECFHVIPGPPRNSRRRTPRSDLDVARGGRLRRDRVGNYFHCLSQIVLTHHGRLRDGLIAICRRAKRAGAPQARQRASAKRSVICFIICRP